MGIARAVVVGAGVMGPGIALTLARAGIGTSLVDIDPGALEKARGRVERSLALFREQGVVTGAGAELARASLSYTTDLAGAAPAADLVVEAVPEVFPVKAQVLAEADRLAPAHAIIASNTSSFPVHDLFPNVRPGRFLVTHYFNPPEIMPLVEVVCGPATAPEAVAAIRDLCRRTGKTAVVLRRYLPGFVVNRLQAAMLREVMFMWDQDLVSPEDMDLAVRASIGFGRLSVGPFAGMDLIGLDTLQNALAMIYPMLCNDGAPPRRLQELVDAGHLGVKTGRGILDYAEGKGEELVRLRDRRMLVALKAWQEIQNAERGEQP